MQYFSAFSVTKIMPALFIALLILIIDQLSKSIVLKNFHPGESFPVIKNIFHISLVFNKGIAFGVFSDQANFVFIWVPFATILIIVFIFTLYKKIFQKRKSLSDGRQLTQIFLSLILAGAIGNLIDRLRFGFVIDFLDFRIWPVFNIADSAITIGTTLLLLQMLRRKQGW